MPFGLRFDDRTGRLRGPIDAVAEAILEARKTVALTGAGISVESGVPDFRSAEGLWSRFDPMEYATLSCFLANPDKAWELFRAMAETLEGAEPNQAHHGLAELERQGLLAGVVTQNVDGLHQRSGSRLVLEIHGSHDRVHCIGCGFGEPIAARHLTAPNVPACPRCGRALKPAVVLFEEPVREVARIEELLNGCDLMLVVGTSALVAPACLYPSWVARSGGSVIEFNLEWTPLTVEDPGPWGGFVEGPVGRTLPAVVRAVAARRTGAP